MIMFNEVFYVIRLRRWWCDDYDEMYLLCELWDHVKVKMIHGWMWITCVPYYDINMMCRSHKWRVVMKGNSHAILNELMIWYTNG